MGFEDSKLFEFAKDELIKISANDTPFNFTLLTVDTHAEDGYLDDLCNHDFDEQLANVIACSSRQVNNFITWVSEQDFYNNTTIVIVGDHKTMNPVFTNSIQEDYVRTMYNSFINTNIELNTNSFMMKNRDFSSLDLFPTTLASINVKIEGDKLGLGVNLFSDKKTLLEEYGMDLSNLLTQKSEFYNNTFIYNK